MCHSVKVINVQQLHNIIGTIKTKTIHTKTIFVFIACAKQKYQRFSKKNKLEQ